MRIRILAGVTADVARRTLVGTVYRYGEIGATSAGPLAVGPTMPPPPIGLPLTQEHDRGIVRGAVRLVDNNAERLRVAVRVVDGELGDAALAEADPLATRKRAGFSFDIEDAEVVDGVIVSGRWEALGQVGEPAFNSARIDQIAASKRKVKAMLTDEQRARLEELRSRTDLNDDETAELNALATLDGQNPPAEPANPAPPAAPAPAAAATGGWQINVTPPGAAAPAEPIRAAAVPAVPAGVPSPTAVVRETGEQALGRFIRELTSAFRAPDRVSAISAALADVTNTANPDVEAPAWSGELWSGLQYVPEWTDLFETGSLTSWSGTGWRFTDTPEMQDYAGDKAEIPTGGVTTEDSGYTAARLAVGVDVDRKFFDFPNEAFIRGLLEKIRESWEIRLDEKVRAYTVAQAVAATRPLVVTTTNGDATVEAPAGSFTQADVGATITAAAGIPGGTTILSVTDDNTIELSANATATGARTVTIGAQEGSVLKSAARAILTLKRRRVGKATFVYLNDEDMFSLLDLNEDAVPAFLDLYDVEPRNFRSSPDVPAGTVLAGVRQAATLRTLPGSPIRVSAQNLAHGGVDEAAFGYWAIEEQHTSAIAKVVFRPAA